MGKPKAATVTLLVFSGRPDPQWELDEEEAERLQRSLRDTARNQSTHKPPLLGLGYRGIRIEFSSPDRGEPTTFIVAKGVVTESPGPKEHYFVDGAGVERLLLSEARKRHHGDLLDRLGVEKQDRDSDSRSP